MLAGKMFRTVAAAVLAIFPSIINAASVDLGCCQTPNDAAPLNGCPDGTLFVSQSNALANFTTVQSAVTSLPNSTDSYTILIDAGVYTEQVNVTRQGATTLLGKTTDTSSVAGNLVKITWSAADPNSTVFPDNEYTSTLTVASTLNSSLTGSGPTGFAVPDGTPLGPSDFKAYNLNLTNEFAPYSAGPALALSASYSNSSFYTCYFGSYQDTIYVGKLGNAYFAHSTIAGQTDFLYGFGTMYATNGTLQLRSCGGGITAWKGTNTTFTNKYGVYLNQNAILAENATVEAQELGKCAMGRPWNSLHRSIFMENYLDADVLPAGYVVWDTAVDSHTVIPGETLLGEYKDFGPGFNATARAAGNLTIELTDEQVAAYRWPKDVFLTPDGSPNDLSWIDPAYLVPASG